VSSKTLTWVLGGLAVSLAVALTIVVLQRPPTTTQSASAPDAGSTSASSPSSSLPPSPATTDSGAVGGPGDLPSSEVQEHGDASPGGTPYSQTDAARQQWEPVAAGFGRAFTATKGKTAGQWRADLAPFVTAKVGEQLATVDLRNVPAGVFSSIEPAEYGEDKVAVFVHYDTGLTLVAYVLLDGAGWRIYAYDRWEE
jgi:hypothetical protein